MLRIIGDVHGLIDAPRKDGFSYNKNGSGRTYLNLIKGCEHTLQVGDMGYGESFHQKMSQINEKTNRVILGNHDDYNRIIPHSLGDFGFTNIGGESFAFLRGANSIDKAYRTADLDWWANEELSYTQGNEARNFFYNLKNVNIMVTHECPSFLLDNGHIITKFSGKVLPSYTSKLLNHIYIDMKFHVNTWIFGHHHIDFNEVIYGTRFICLNELAYVDVIDGKVSEVR